MVKQALKILSVILLLGFRTTSALAQTFNPVPWPSDASLRATTSVGQPVSDWQSQDVSNGGTTPQGYVNISSGIPDLSKPSAYFTSDGTTIFLRFRLEASPVAYSGGATASNTDPYKSAQWTLLLDYNGDGWRDFAIFLDGSSGSPSAPTDVIQVLYSTITTSQSIDPALPGNHLLGSIYAGQPYSTGPYAGQLQQYDGNGNLVTTNPWPNGQYTTTYDFGTTRMINQTSTGGQYVIDYQIPASLLNAQAFGGPLLTSSTPLAMAFVTANSLNDPFQKDFSYLGEYRASPNSPFPAGDFITFDGSTIDAPIVTSVSATACPNVTLKTTILDAMKVLPDGVTEASTVSLANFYYWSDQNANSLADEVGGSWVLIGSGSPGPLGTWTRTWNTSSLQRGRYLIKVIATDEQGNVTDSFTENFSGGYANIFASFNNSCGTALPFLTKSVDKTTVSSTGNVAARTVTYTIKVSNPGGSAITLSNLTDQLPGTFSFTANAGGSVVPTSSPTNGATGSINWTFSPAVTIAAGATDSLKFTVLAGTIAGTYANSVSGTGSAPITAAVNTATVVVSDASAALTKSASTSGTLSPGQAFSYSLSYQNNGSVSLTNVQILDTLVAGLNFVSASNGGTYNAGTRVVSWDIGTLSVGQSGVLTLNVSVTSPYTGVSPLRNTAAITSSELSTPVTSNSLSSTVLSPIFTLQKTGSPPNLSPGMVITYTLTYGNQGTASDTNVSIVDTLPSTLTYVVGSSSPLTPTVTTTGSPAQQILRWSIGSLASGSVGNTISFQALVANPYPTLGTNQQITNIAWVSSNQTVAAAATSSLTNTANPNVSLQKLSDQISYSSTDTATFTLTLRNNGNADGALASLVDSLPAGFSYVSTSGGTLSPTSSPSVGATGALTWSFSPNTTLAVGSTYTLIFRARVSNTSNTYTNVANAIGILTGPSTTTISAQTSILVSTGTEALQKSVDKLTAHPGDTLTYTLFYINATGGPQNNRTIRDTLVSGLTFVSQTSSSSGGSVSFTQTGSALIWQPSNPVHDGDWTSITFRARVNNGVAGSTILTNRGWIGKGGGTPAPSNAVTTTVLTSPNITFTKSVNRTSAPVNAQLVYTITYSNAVGAGTATNTVITDTIPNTLTYVSGTATGGAFYSSSPAPKGRLTWNLGPVAGGSSGSFTFITTIDGSTPLNTVITNRAQLTNNENNNKTASVNDTVRGLPNFIVNKSVDRSLAGPGDTVTYTIQYSNTGSAAATGVSLVDTIPTNTAFVSADGGGTLSSGVVSWAIGNVNIGASGTRTLRVQINKPLATNSVVQVTNRAVALCNEIPPTASNSSTTVVGYPLLSINKSVDSASIGVNNDLTYTIVVSNASLVSSTGTVVMDAIPAQTTYVPGSTTLNGSGVSDIAGMTPLATGFAIGTLTSAQPVVITFKVRVDGAAVNGTRISNSASVSSDRITEVSSSSVVNSVVRSLPNLTISKGASLGGPAAPGSTITYTITYGNNGTASADNLTVVDPIPLHTSYVAGSVNGTGAIYDPIGDQIVITRNSLGAGVINQVVTFQVLINSPLPSGNTTITNNVTASAGNAVSANASASTIVSASSAFTISKVGPPNVVLSGSPTPSASFTYVINYAISGNALSDSVRIVDTLPTNLVYQSSTLNGVAAGNAAGQTVTWLLGTQTPGASGQATVTVQTTTAGNYTNTARILSNQDTTGVSGSSGGTTANSSVSGTLQQTPSVLPGQTVSVTVDDADLKGQGLLFVSLTNTTTNEIEQLGLNETALNSGIFTATINTIFGVAAGTSNDGFFICQAGDSLRTTYVDAVRANGNPGNVFTSTIVTGGFAATIQTTPGLIAAGNSVSFTITDSDLNHDSLLAESYSFSVQSSTGESENLTFTESGAASGVFAAVLPTIPGTTPGANNNGSMTVQPGDSLFMSYFDSLASNGGTGATVSAFATVGSVDFSGSSKSVFDNNGIDFGSGDTLTYTIQVKNFGTATATAVSVVDTLPASLNVVSGSISGGGVLNGNLITFAAFDLAPNDSVSLTFNVIIDSSVLDQASVQNIASISANGVEQLVSVAFTASNRPMMVLSKVSNVAISRPGDTLIYTIQYSNIGTSRAAQVVVADSIPANTDYIAASVTLDGVAKTDASDADEANIAGTLITVNVGQVQIGQSGTITYRVRVR